MLDTEILYFLESLKPEEHELREAYDYTMALPNTYYEDGSYTKWMRVVNYRLKIRKSYNPMWVENIVLKTIME
jgi:hypothetical protein